MMPPGYCEVRVIASCAVMEHFLGDFGLNLGCWRVNFKRNGEKIGFGEHFGVQNLSQIGFGTDDDDFPWFVGSDEVDFRLGDGLGGINEAKGEIGLGQGVPGSADAFLFDFAGSVAQPGGIDQMDGIALESDEFFDRVAGGAGVGGDNGAVAAGQEIEEGGLAGIGGAGNDNPGAVAKQMALLPGIEQGLNAVDNGGILAASSSGTDCGSSLSGKSQHGFDVRAQGEEGVGKDRGCDGEGIFELGGGKAGRAFGTGMDEVEDRLG